jgi:hypothetical protein
MFSTTFLGHQGWLFQSKRSCFLVDPLLCEDFGHTQALEYRVFPPRVFQHDKLPPIDAVFLTHEHDDHFDIPSLAKLDRKIPLHLSARSSTAAHRILAEMGFVVQPLAPGVRVRYRDLEFMPFTGDHVTVACGDEWDTLPFIVKHTGGSGTFFSMVDIPITEGHVQKARAYTSEPGIVGWTNNALDWCHMAEYLRTGNDATQDCFVKLGVGHKLISELWAAPSATLMCAGGFSFVGPRAWMNRLIFSVNNDLVCQTMAQIYPNELFAAARPGLTLVMEGNRVRSAEESAPFLSTEPPASWPVRGKDDTSPVEDYAPATGRRALDAGDLERVRAGLDVLAGALVGTAAFRSLHSLSNDEAPDRKMTFALVLRDGDARHVLEYVPNACAFIAGAADAQATYLAGLECWASDLLAILDGDLGPIALSFGRARLWNALPLRFNFDLFEALYNVSHPLRRPDRYFATYRKRWQESAGTQPTIGARIA